MSKATLKFIRLSPIKARLITKQIQGMNAELALASLEFMPNKAAGIIAKVIASACANGDYEPEEVTILSARSDKGPVLKRFKPRARGSASRILKPTAHIMIEVGTSSETKEAPKEAKKVEKKTETKKAEKKVKAKEEAPESVPKAKANDDLLQLSGVGPAMVKKLNAENITSIEQVADMTKEEIAELDAKIGLKGKIEDTWQAEAKEILNNNKKES
ncbi:MAG TPA: 50S ribosomal protein L22 [Campylobacterales bacterium]|nr:50S ribosomal protein L22 [Campylobacterales bacterium]